MSCTLVNSKDLVAYSGFRRVAENITPASQGALTTAIRGEMVAAGWTELSSGSDANGPSYELLSCQSPWFDPSDIPSWYENQLHLQFNNTLSGRISVTPSAWDGASTYMTASSPLILDYRDETADWTVHASPYQLAVWNNITPNSNIRVRSLIAAALNLPQYVQEQGVRNMLFATQRLMHTDTQEMTGLNDPGFDWSAHNVVGGSDLSYRSQLGSTHRIQFPLVTSRSLSNNYSASALWNQTLDPTMIAPEDWQPFIQPAYLMYPLDSTTAVVSVNGYLWDCFITTRWASWLAEAIIQSSRWLNVVGKSSGLTSGVQGALFILMDEAGV